MTKVSIDSTFQLYKRIWSYMSAHWKRFLISIAAMAVAAATEPAFARVLKYLIDSGFTDRNKTAMYVIPIIVVGIFLLRGLASYVNDYNTTWLSSSIVEEMRQSMFKRLLKLPVQYYDNNNSGRIISRVVFDVTQITEAGFNLLTVTIKDGVTIIGLLALLFYTNWQLTIFCVVTLPFVLVLVRILSKRLRKLGKTNQSEIGVMTQILSEAVQGQKIVKLFGGQDYETTRFHQSIANIKRNSVKQKATASLNTGLSQFLVSISLAMILYFATARSAALNFTAGDFVSFISAVALVFAPMKRITSVTQSLQTGLAAAESVFSFIDSTEEEDSGNRELSRVSGTISIQNLSFKYPSSERQILDNVNLEIKAGENVALVGSSGSGKTTLANLIPRFYHPQQGRIMVDNISLEDVTLESLRANIALVSQEVILFNDTVYNNIAYGTFGGKSTYEEVMQAAKQANALEFIEQLAEGMNTMIGENGTRLSGGQKQRLAIARAILKNAPILILDEATSALDNQSEKLVQEALERLMHNRTTVVIAHRLSTIQNADKIVVLERGNIVEIGKHDELLAKNGVYASLYNIQFKA